MLSTSLTGIFPFLTTGTVCTGFGRGGKDLGFPTANLDDVAASSLPDTLDNGVYYGWAKVGQDEVRKMATSIGFNPHYNNSKKTIEVYILHNYTKDFYGERLKIMLVGFLRSMKTFTSFEELKECIATDVEQASKLLDTEPAQALKNHSYFQENN